MAIDICIAVLLCAVTIIMGYLGVHVTLHPTEEPRKQRRFKIGFWSCGIFAISLIAVQTARNANTQSTLTAQLDKIQHNTEQPPKIEVNVPPAQVVVKNGEIRQRVGLERKRFQNWVPVRTGL
jgi:hypothetical protein